MTNLERAAIAWANEQEDIERSISNLVGDGADGLARAAADFAASLETVAPGLDPTPAALAREVQSAAEKATPRPWRAHQQQPWQVAWCIDERGTELLRCSYERADDLRFAVTACNAAEALSRAVLEGEERERAARGRVGELETLLREAERLESGRGEGDDSEHTRGNWLARTRAALKEGGGR